MLVIKYGANIIVIDAGLTFPEDEMLGVDIVIPDISYLIENKHLIRGILLTHGHEDHIGALPFVLDEINAPVYGSPLTLGLLKDKINEKQAAEVKLIQVKPRETVKLGPFSVEFFRVSHSIPDVLGTAITTPAGTVVYTSDFKLDQTPIDGEVTDFRWPNTEKGCPGFFFQTAPMLRRLYHVGENGGRILMKYSAVPPAGLSWPACLKCPPVAAGVYHCRKVPA